MIVCFILVFATTENFLFLFFTSYKFSKALYQIFKPAGESVLASLGSLREDLGWRGVQLTLYPSDYSPSLSCYPPLNY